MNIQNNQRYRLKVFGSNHLIWMILFFLPALFATCVTLTVILLAKLLFFQLSTTIRVNLISKHDRKKRIYLMMKISYGLKWFAVNICSYPVKSLGLGTKNRSWLEIYLPALKKKQRQNTHPSFHITSVRKVLKEYRYHLEQLKILRAYSTLLSLHLEANIVGLEKHSVNKSRLVILMLSLLLKPHYQIIPHFHQGKNFILHLNITMIMKIKLLKMCWQLYYLTNKRGLA